MVSPRIAPSIAPGLQHPCGRTVARPGWGRSRENSLNLRDHELWFVWRGGGWMETHAGRFSLRPGFLAWMRPGGIYDAGLAPGQSLSFTYIHFTCDLPDPPEFFQVGDIGYMDAATRRIVDLVERAPRARWGRPAHAPPAAGALLEAVLLDLLDRPAHREAAAAPPHRDAIEAIAADLRDAPERPIDVAALARSLGLTLPHFSRTFRSQMGLSPRQYHLRARLDRARHLLAESDLNLTQIADTLGYRDLFHFSKQFARHAGTSPSGYRRSLKPGDPAGNA